MAFAQPQPVNTDIECPNPPEDSISSLSFAQNPPPGVDYLAVASWSSEVRVYEISSTGQTQPKASYKHEAPVLSVIWSADSTKLISGGCDNAARMYDIATGQTTQVAVHDQPIRSVAWVNIPGAPDCHLVTGSWDKTLKYWDLRQSTPIASLPLPERLYALDSQGQWLVAGCADRHNVVYNLSDPSKPFKTLRAATKWQTRVIRCSPADPTGQSKACFLTGSIEGRVGVYYIEGTEADNYSFKCHRTDIMPKPPGLEKPNTNIWPVNDISFNVPYGTCATAGGDGCISFWDIAGKQRLKEMPNRGGSITSVSFNKTATICAYALSYDWGAGHQGNSGQTPTKIMLSPLKEEDVQKKKRR